MNKIIHSIRIIFCINTHKLWLKIWMGRYIILVSYTGTKLYWHKDKIDTHQFAYQANKSVHDAVLTFAHSVFEELDKKQRYARALFIDFSSAYNTLQLHCLIQKLRALNAKPSLILWICDFLTQRTQRVRVSDKYWNTARRDA